MGYGNTEKSKVERYIDKNVCSSCGNSHLKEYYNYCYQCGVKLDWNKE